MAQQAASDARTVFVDIDGIVVAPPVERRQPAATEPLGRAAEGAQADDGFHLRSEAEFRRFFDGLELVEPGTVPVTSWRTESDFVAPMLAAVGREP
ncbi:MAG TPA: SAM-dependent methyltransferase [Acidimicrobiales bacterium]